MAEPSKKEPPRYDHRYEPRSSILSVLVRNLMSLFFIGVAVMCVYNVFGVGGEVEVMAKETACRGQPLPCTAQYTRAQRTPWSHTFKMYTGPSSGELDVSCQRQYILVGEYACTSKNDATVSVDPAGAASASERLAPSSSGLVRFPPKTKIPVPNRPQPVAPAASP